VAIHGVGEHRGNPYIVMDFVDGMALDERLKRKGPFEPREAAEVIRTLCGAVQHAHDRSILHRDLKPANVLLGADGRPWITDFGLAKDLSEERERLTRTGVFLGTPGFMPPEQADADVSRIGRCSDIYSLGATLYALLTGVPPFEGASVVNLLAAVLLEEAKAPSTVRPDLDPALDAIVLKCLAKSPNYRYLSATALGEDLGRFLRGEAVEARGPKSKARAKSSRTIPLALAALGVVIGLSALGVILSTSPPNDKRDPSVVLSPDEGDSGRVEPPPAESPPPVETTEIETASLDPNDLLSRFRRPPSWTDGVPPGFPELLLTVPTSRGHGRLAVSGDGRRALTGASRYRGPGAGVRSRGVALWNLDEEQPALRRWERVRPGLRHVAGVPSGDRFLFKDGPTLRLISAEEGTVQEQEWDVGPSLQVLTLSADGRWAAVAMGAAHRSPRSVLVFDLARDAQPLTSTSGSHAARPNCLSFSSDGTRLATGSGREAKPQQGEVAFFDTATGEKLGGIPFEEEQVTSVAISPDDSHIAALTAEGRLYLVKIVPEGLRLVDGVRAFESEFEDLAWHPNGLSVYAVALREGICRWDVKSGSLRRWRLDGYSTGVAIAPDGSRLILGYLGRIEVWGGL
jgi:serine/threonine protein kinase